MGHMKSWCLRAIVVTMDAVEWAVVDVKIEVAEAAASMSGIITDWLDLPEEAELVLRLKWGDHM